MFSFHYLLSYKSVECAAELGKSVFEEFRLVEGARPVTDDIAELLLNRTWRPTLSVTGVDGLPHITQVRRWIDEREKERERERERGRERRRR